LILCKSDGKSSQFDEIWQTRHFWEQTGPAKKKGSKITRTCKTTSIASDFRYSCSCGHHRTNQGLPLHEVVEVKRSFWRSPRPNFGFHLVLTSFHIEFSSLWILRLFDLSDLSVLKNGSPKHFENGLKSMQIFQRVMGGMNCR
jgi:hypothetical protein